MLNNLYNKGGFGGNVVGCGGGFGILIFTLGNFGLGGALGFGKPPGGVGGFGGGGGN
ncbi:hypothetical protein ACI6Q2_20650 [Chitinophagaceae bacterium LWZ2-11]